MKEIIRSEKVPSPIGPYSQAVKAGNTLYCSGQIALDAETGELVLDNIKVETHKVMQNLYAVLSEANMSFDNVVKCSIFLADMGQFNEVNEVYASYFDERPPARETVEVSVLPKNVNVEISLIAVD